MAFEPKINICIPFEPDANLGREYNRIMEESKREWVLLLDHDCMILNPHWYHLCQEAIRRRPGAGLFTAFGSAGGCRFQRIKGAPGRDQSIPFQRTFAKKVFFRFNLGCTLNVPGPKNWISGFFMLTSKSAWRKAGGFGEKGMFAQDHLYHKRIVAAGLEVYRIDGIYCFHLLERTDGSWVPHLKTSKELWGEYWAAKHAAALAKG